MDQEWFLFLRTGPSLVVAGLEEHLNTHPGHWAPRTRTVSYFKNPVGRLGEPRGGSVVGVCLTDLGQPLSVLGAPQESFCDLFLRKTHGMIVREIT